MNFQNLLMKNFKEYVMREDLITVEADVPAAKEAKRRLDELNAKGSVE